MNRRREAKLTRMLIQKLKEDRDMRKALLDWIMNCRSIKTE